jgi:hypothetical protein
MSTKKLLLRLVAEKFFVSISSPLCRYAPRFESRVKPEVLQALRDKGDNLIVQKEYSTLMGRGQAVIHNSKSGMNSASSDPRADGVAEPEPPEIRF